MFGEDLAPFAERLVGGDQQRSALVARADQFEQDARLRLVLREIGEIVEDDEVEAGEIVGKPTLAAGSALGFEAIDEIDGVEETTA